MSEICWFEYLMVSLNSSLFLCFSPYKGRSVTNTQIFDPQINDVSFKTSLVIIRMEDKAAFISLNFKFNR
jgi:hypothetical protein